MPPRDDYDMPLMFYFKIGDELREIGDIPTITIDTDHVIMDEQTYMPMDFCLDSSCEIKAYTRYIHGLFDSMCGVDSIHAWRYKRWCKRRKEKERRKKLKGEKVK